ncbi:MSMEG_0569 family flavin-dependent oxidoreductase [Lichenicola cladoniae]|uniref:MSMEG_0569 family flavin-dependent oxidoreductase n=1 Tax=Lichenicola cladoniae TaxID=1484109 RepID=A0A6M8HNJ3_9PROT|nr:MSMEG_0569 family flavin-dependent oxidoreductase [Lichenicola cladoniae]NPD67375.1 MSMEG_0569 family flavin-dependent oxidoreductase [Acetobacteraceae bacterium]QKE89871.1 MSMEG_0569 family flavin-dependent oxidoreductase [Lichenicola cladoniae]
MTVDETGPGVEHKAVVIVGGGQAGLSLSWFLCRDGIDHVVLERETPGHTWRNERWDSFCLVTPNWQCQLPGYPYAGNDPYGFMVRDEIVAYLDGFAKSFSPPVRSGVSVDGLTVRAEGGFALRTSAGALTADRVVIATGGYHDPILPPYASALDSSILQVHSSDYRNGASLPDGAVLVVGTGQSGAQIAEDLHLAGRQVHLCVGAAPRVARFYRGKDVVEWLHLMGYYDISVDRHPLREGVRDRTNHYVTGRDGGRDIDLRRFAVEGMRLHGSLSLVGDGIAHFNDDLAANLDDADRTSENIKRSIDQYIERERIEAPVEAAYVPAWQPERSLPSLDLREAGIGAVIWCIGFRPNYRWINVPVFDGRGVPAHHRGVTPQPGLFFLGLPWLYTWGSGRFSGVARDAEYLSTRMHEQRRV